MLRNRVFHDVVVGGGLVVTLLMIFLIDRLVSSPVPHGSEPGVSVVRKPGTLLGDHHIVVHLKALGSQERLEKLKVVRLSAKASFANATNVNDLTLMWCWEPKIIIRFTETHAADATKKASEGIDLLGEIAKEQLLGALKAGLDLDRNLTLQLDREAGRLFQARNYKPFIDTEFILDDKKGFRIFNEKLSLPMQADRSTPMKNLFFALSVSNLIPIRRHNFEVIPGAQQTVRGRKCDEFTVHDPDGLRLQFFFDAETHLLAKIAHMGHDPRALPGSEKQAFWEHYFSDYRESEGIKQWRKAEIDNDGQRFATLDVTRVHFFDELRPELQRPGR